MHRFPNAWNLTDLDASVAPTVDTQSALGSVRGAIPCQLVRGVQSAADGSGAENHMWNVVRLGSESFVVDVMQRPGELLAAGSKEAQAYQRVVLVNAVAGAHDKVRCSEPADSPIASN